MEEKYATELRERDPATVDTLFLDNSDSGKLGGINGDLVNLTVSCYLSMLSRNINFCFSDAQHGQVWFDHSHWIPKLASFDLFGFERQSTRR